MINLEYEALSKIDTETLLGELAYRIENFGKYKLLEGKYNSFNDYDGEPWAVKFERRGEK